MPAVSADTPYAQLIVGHTLEAQPRPCWAGGAEQQGCRVLHMCCRSSQVAVTHDHPTTQVRVFNPAGRASGEQWMNQDKTSRQTLRMEFAERYEGLAQRSQESPALQALEPLLWI